MSQEEKNEGIEEALKARAKLLTEWQSYLKVNQPKKQGDLFEHLNKISLIEVERIEIIAKLDRMESDRRNNAEIEAICKDRIPELLERINANKHRLSREELQSIGRYDENLPLKDRWQYYQLFVKLIQKYAIKRSNVKLLT